MAAIAHALYPAVLVAHSYLRWVVLAVLLVSLARAALAWSANRAFEPRDERAVRVLIGAVDTQILLGIALYVFLSPISSAGVRDLGATMREATLRFFTIEHPFAMILAVAVIHARTGMTRRLGADPRRHRAVFASCAIALALIAASIPWPGLRYARPLLRAVW
jgi:hypothetical protein